MALNPQGRRAFEDYTQLFYLAAGCHVRKNRAESFEHVPNHRR
ncbi:MAG: hypothetical protein ACRDR6_24905 [Pseudonocardiaceae bacterium]